MVDCFVDAIRGLCEFDRRLELGDDSFVSFFVAVVLQKLESDGSNLLCDLRELGHSIDLSFLRCCWSLVLLSVVLGVVVKKDRDGLPSVTIGGTG